MMVTSDKWWNVGWLMEVDKVWWRWLNFENGQYEVMDQVKLILLWSYGLIDGGSDS